jgi:hypothetical protein
VFELLQTRLTLTLYNQFCPGSLAFALATLSLDGSRPEVRNVGIKRTLSLSPDKNPGRLALLCTTDIRTPKVTQIQKNPECSLTCWVPAELLQIRIQAKSSVFGINGWLGNSSEIGEEPVEVDMKSLREELFADENFRSRTRAWHANPTPGEDLGESREGWIEELVYSTNHSEVRGSVGWYYYIRD